MTGLPVAIIAGCPAVAEAKLDGVEEVVVVRSPLEADEVVRGDGDNLRVLILGQAHRWGPDASVPVTMGMKVDQNLDSGYVNLVI